MFVKVLDFYLSKLQSKWKIERALKIANFFYAITKRNSTFNLTMLLRIGLLHELSDRNKYISIIKKLYFICRLESFDQETERVELIANVFYLYANYVQNAKKDTEEAITLYTMVEIASKILNNFDLEHKANSKKMDLVKALYNQ